MSQDGDLTWCCDLCDIGWVKAGSSAPSDMNAGRMATRSNSPSARACRLVRKSERLQCPHCPKDLVAELAPRRMGWRIRSRRQPQETRRGDLGGRAGKLSGCESRLRGRLGGCFMSCVPVSFLVVRKVAPAVSGADVGVWTSLLSMAT